MNIYVDMKLRLVQVLIEFAAIKNMMEYIATLMVIFYSSEIISKLIEHFWPVDDKPADIGSIFFLRISLCITQTEI